MRPQRRLERAVCEQHAVFGEMRQRQAFERTEEGHAVLAGHGAAAQGGKADVARLARAGDAVAAAIRMLIERDAAAGGGGLAQHQRSARGRIDLHAVMGFDDLDVEALVECLGDALDHRGEQIDAQAHIARLHHDRAVGDALDHGVVGGRQSGGADDVHDAALGRDRDIGDGRGRHGEIQDAVGVLRHRPEIGREFDAVGRQAREYAGILAEQLRARRLQGSRQHRAFGVGNRSCQRPAHPAACPSNNQTHIGHGSPSPRPVAGAGSSGNRSGLQKARGAGLPSAQVQR